MAGEPTAEEIAASRGELVLEFGAGWCGICQGSRAMIDRVRDEFPGVAYRWIEDGKGRRLGRAFGIKLWPTLVRLRDGREVARAVRPRDEAEVRAVLGADPAATRTTP
jgi:thioredoxin 1